jgi:hypothetical protein
MNQLNLDGREIARRGQIIYESLRGQVETASNIGKIISIDIETGNFEIDDDILRACSRLQKSHPEAILWTERIGFNAVYAVGGALTKVADSD